MTMSLFFCCSNKTKELSTDENGLPIITSQYKLDFIKEVLNDTSQINFKWYNDPYIFIVNDDEKVYTVNENSKIRHLKKIDYLSLKLTTNNISFIEGQLSNDLKNEDLISYGFRSIIWDELIDYHFDDDDLDIEYLVTEDSIAKVEELLKDKGILYLSTPIFNTDLDLALMESEHGVTGETILFEKKNNKWITKTIISQWIR